MEEDREMWNELRGVRVPQVMHFPDTEPRTVPIEHYMDTVDQMIAAEKRLEAAIASRDQWCALTCVAGILFIIAAVIACSL